MEAIFGDIDGLVQESSVLEVEAKFATSAIMKRIRIGGMQN